MAIRDEILKAFTTSYVYKDPKRREFVIRIPFDAIAADKPDNDPEKKLTKRKKKVA